MRYERYRQTDRQRERKRGRDRVTERRDKYVQQVAGTMIGNENYCYHES